MNEKKKATILIYFFCTHAGKLDWAFNYSFFGALIDSWEESLTVTVTDWLTERLCLHKVMRFECKQGLHLHSLTIYFPFSNVALSKKSEGRRVLECGINGTARNECEGEECQFLMSAAEMLLLSSMAVESLLWQLSAASIDATLTACLCTLLL